MVNLDKNHVEFLLPDRTFYSEAPAGMEGGGEGRGCREPLGGGGGGRAG